MEVQAPPDIGKYNSDYYVGGIVSDIETDIEADVHDRDCRMCRIISVLYYGLTLRVLG